MVSQRCQARPRYQNNHQATHRRKTSRHPLSPRRLDVLRNPPSRHLLLPQHLHFLGLGRRNNVLSRTVRSARRSFGNDVGSRGSSLGGALGSGGGGRSGGFGGFVGEGGGCFVESRADSWGSGRINRPAVRTDGSISVDSPFCGSSSSLVAGSPVKRSLTVSIPETTVSRADSRYEETCAFERQASRRAGQRDRRQTHRSDNPARPLLGNLGGLGSGVLGGFESFGGALLACGKVGRGGLGSLGGL